MQAVTVNGVTLHYRTDGPPEGPAVVLLNSLGTDLRLWERVMPPLTARLRVVRHDQRGHGLSACPAGPYTIDLLAGDVAALLDHLGIARAAVVGLSVGGMIAQALAAARPDRVAALVLCNTGHRIGPPTLWDERIAAIRQGGIEVAADAILARWFAEAFCKARPDELAVWRAMLSRTPLEGYLATCAAIRDADLGAVAPTIAVPTLCVAGSQDQATPPALVSELAALIPGARYVEIDGAGHLPCVDKADVLAGHIVDFLKEHWDVFGAV